MTKMLYVEDNDGNVYMLRGRLTRAGFEVAVATDGERLHAVVTLRKARPLVRGLAPGKSSPPKPPWSQLQ